MATKKDINKPKGKKICSACGEPKNLTDFYISFSPMFATDGRIPICSECCKTTSLNEDGSINYAAFKKLLMHTDKPLYYDLLWSSENAVKKENSYISEEEVALHGYDILTKYYRLVAMKQDRAKSYADAEKEGHMHQSTTRTASEKSQILSKYKPIFDNVVVIGEDGESTSAKTNIKPNTKEKTIVSNHSDFEVTQDMIDLFGDGYKPSMYKKMYDKYEKLKLNYSIQTNLHQEALATYVRFKVQEEIETANGNVSEAKKWYDAATTAAQDAKLTPKQLTQADLQGGINSFSEIFKAVEQAVDVIPILPRFKFRPNDALDFNIWCYINYARDLQGLPQCSYEDVYKFYDKKKAEYLEQYGDPYGIFDDEPTEKNRPNVEKFITLPNDYEDGGE